MSRNSNYLGESAWVAMTGKPTAAPTLVTDGKGRAEWDGFYNVKAILHAQKTASLTLKVWVYEGIDGSETWHMAQSVALSEATNESAAVEGLSRAKRIYVQWSSATGAVGAAMQFFG